ncbi:hypothetical protein HYV79_00990 [Candidatus Woesearchaeota archaeon]|nr:hypothetical protein [Candidatus Woesearchaeota archaeon]
MTVLGLGFTKINLEKKKAVDGKVNIQSNANILNVEKADLRVTSKQGALKFTFDFVSQYDPDVATLRLEGDVLWLDSLDETEKVLKNWKKDKKVSPEIMVPVLNAVLSRAHIEALILTRELNLPPPIQLPRVEAKQIDSGKST